MRNHSGKKLVGLLLALASYTASSFAIDNAHFWKSARFHGNATDGPTTARWENDEDYRTADWLSKLDVSYAYGSAKRGWNNKSVKTSLLNIWGPQNMLYLFTNVVKKISGSGTASIDFANFLGNNINHSMTNGTFGQLEFTGKFRLHDINLDFRQNFAWGLFLEMHLPIRNIEVRDVGYVDKSPAACKNSQNSPDWIRFKNSLNTILTNYGYHKISDRYDKTDVGDLSMLVGWDYVDPDTFDFLKWFRFNFKVGALFPTSPKPNPDYVFAPSTGYGDHWGIPLSGLISFGIVRWLELSARGGAIFFFDKDMQQRIKTHSKQQGPIMLTKGLVEEDKGTVWHVGTDLKFDHIFGGFSALFGYSFNKGERSHWKPKETCCTGTCSNLTSIASPTESVVDSDTRLLGWYQHVLHFMIDYDFSVHGGMRDCKAAPRVNVFYNLPVDGKNAFDTDMIGGGLGVDVRWDF